MADDTIPCILSVAGSDSGGGAGIQADLKAFTALSCHGMTAITALTAQNTQGVRAVEPVAPEVLRQQIDTVVSDIGVSAVKSGMLANAANVEVLSDALESHNITSYFLDPVVRSESGQALLDEDGLEKMKTLLFPKALVITPNLSEAELLTGMSIRNESEMEAAAVKFFDLGPGYVLLTGGHLPGGQAIDMLYDGIGIYPFVADKLEAPNNHGTGCTFTAALTAYYARGFELGEAIAKAKFFVHNALINALDIGHGKGPVNPFWNL